ISFAWNPRITSGWLKPLLSENRLIIRGGYRQSYLNDQMITALRNAAIGNAGLATTAVSVINPVTGTSQLNARLSSLPSNVTLPTPPPVVVPRTFAQNNTAAFSNFGTVFAINPNIQTPRVEEYNFGIQRESGANAIEIRYVGTSSDNLWRSIDYNQIDIRSNGFAADFIRARNNLLINEAERARLVASGLSQTQVNQQLPLSAAYNANLAGSQQLTVFPNLVGGGNLTNANNITSIRNGVPADLALSYVQNLQTGTVKFLPNPGTGVANLLTNGAKLRYNSLQVEFRRRFTKGLFIQSNYTFQKTLSNGIGTSQQLVEPFLDNLQPQLEYARADYDTTHIFKTAAVYELPFGQGRQFFGGANRAADLIIGGWQFNPIITITSGAPMTIIDPRGTLNRAGRAGRQTAASNLTKDQIKDLIGIRKTPTGVYYISASVINPATGRAAEGFGSTPFSGQAFFNVAPGQTGNLERAIINGPIYFNIDASVAKNIRIREGVRLQLRLEAFNALNRANFGVSAAQQLSIFNISSANFGRITQTFSGTGRIFQIGGRLDF
ncbi:MAG TPA: hypothetical protein VEF04_05510, partial [Blastocatellia bacterium]|nr:hypothetical protein [Blastocatellia bacterium]